MSSMISEQFNWSTSKQHEVAKLTDKICRDFARDPDVGRLITDVQNCGLLTDEQYAVMFSIGIVVGASMQRHGMIPEGL